MPPLLGHLTRSLASSSLVTISGNTLMIIHENTVMIEKPGIDAGRILAEFVRRGGTEVIRVAVRPFNDKPFLDLRVWWRRDECDDWKPSKTGVALHADEVAVVATVLTDAQRLMAPAGRA